MTYMAKVQYPHSGGTVTYPFNFVGGYLDPAHVKVDITLAGVTTTGTATLIGAGTASVTAGAGSIITLRRETPRVTLTNFLGDTQYREESLDTAARQALLVCGELYDALQDAGGLTPIDTTGFARLSGGNIFSGHQNTGTSTVEPVTVGGVTQVTIDAGVSNNFQVTLGATSTQLTNPTNARDGMVINVFLRQDSTGSRSITYGSKYKWPGGAQVGLTPSPNAVDLLVAQYNSSLDIWVCSMLKDFR